MSPAQPNATTEFVYVNAVADLLFVDIQLWFPPVDMVNVDVRENVPIGLFRWTVGWREVF